MDERKAATLRAVERFDLHPWFKSDPMSRPYARHILEYMDEEILTGKAVLELGCGIGQNLAVLWDYGFEVLCGVERDPLIYSGAVQFCQELEVDASLELGDACSFPYAEEYWDVILPLNWTYQKGIDLPLLFSKWHTALDRDGILIIDIIEASFPPEKAPEYAQRFSRAQIEQMIEGKYGIMHTAEYYPRTVYYMEKE